jgi:uncharacterized RDD family membrane protein YckC
MNGSLSVAPICVQLIALIIDWALCYLIISAVIGHRLFTGTNDPHYSAASWGTLALFVFEVYLLTAVSGLTIGKRMLGIRVIRTNGGIPGFRWAALRTGLLLFVIPACLTDRDLRGMHDRAADTIVVRI